MIEFEAYKKNVHCAKVEILKLFGKTRKDREEISGGESNDELGMEDPMENVDSEVEEEEEEAEVQGDNRKEIPAPYGQVYGDQHRVSSWPHHHHSQHQHPLSQHLQHHISQPPRQQMPMPPPIAQLHPSHQDFPEVPKVPPEWPHIPKDISVRPICPAVPQKPRMPESYLSQSGVHFLAGALMTNEKEVSKEIPVKAEQNVEKTSKLRNEEGNWQEEVYVKQEVEEVEDQNLDEE
ncbi:hypothetical protein J437_LFUL016500, partial [Ladona fulva]